MLLGEGPIHLVELVAWILHRIIGTCLVVGIVGIIGCTSWNLFTPVDMLAGNMLLVCSGLVYGCENFFLLFLIVDDCVIKSAVLKFARDFLRTVRV